MTPLLMPILAGVAAVAMSLAIGYGVLRRLKAAEPGRGPLNALPLMAGLVAGGVVLMAGGASFLPDRFYDLGDGWRIVLAVLAGCALVWSVEWALPRGRFWHRTGWHVAAQVLAAGVLVAAGVRFDLVKVPGEGVTQLGGEWGAVMTIAWIVVATNMIRLLDGLHGLACLVLAVVALSSVYANAVVGEYLLVGISLVLAGTALGAMRFCTRRHGLLLEGGGTAVVGLLFAVLTVLARQKSVMTYALMVPLVAVLAIAGTAMLSMLQRRLLPSGYKQDVESSAKDEKPL